MSDLIERLWKSAEHVRSTSKGGMEYEARLMEKAAAALEAAQEDAERYRWLRDDVQTNRAPHIYQYPAQSFDNPKLPHFKDVGLDTAIDQARGKGVTS